MDASDKLRLAVCGLTPLMNKSNLSRWAWARFLCRKRRRIQGSSQDGGEGGTPNWGWSPPALKNHHVLHSQSSGCTGGNS